MKGLPLAPNMYLPSSSEKTEAFVHSTPAKSRRPSRSAILQGCLVAVLTLAFYVLLKISNAHVTVNYHIEQPEESPQHRTIGLVSYSGRDRLAILDRYLKRDLTSNGGVLDAVIFVPTTVDTLDLEYLNNLVSTSPSYSQLALEETPRLSPTEQGSMYIAIDDAIVFIAPHTLRHLITTKQAHPSHTLISANVLSTSVILPPRAGTPQNIYLPEPAPLSPASLPSSTGAWRASELPSWPGVGTPETTTTSSTFSDDDDDDDVSYSAPDIFPPPGLKYRWLPLRDGTIDSTAFVGPDGMHGDEEFGKVDRSRYEMAVQAHYSFLENVEQGRLDRYLLRMQGRQASGMLAVWERDVRDVRVLFRWGREVVGGVDGEEEDDVLSIPTDGVAFAVKMDAGLEAVWRGTDLRERYAAYAGEMVWREEEEGSVDWDGGKMVDL